MTTPAPRAPSRDPRTPGQVLGALVPSVYAPTLLEFVGLASLMPVIPLLARDLGFSVPMAAALTTIFGLTSFLGPIPAGRLISRIGARLALVITGALLVLSNLAAFAIIGPALGGGAEAHHRLALVALLLVMAVSIQVWQLGRQSYLGTALPPSMRARGMTLFGGVIRIGEVVGPLLGAAVMALGSMAGVFLLFAASAAAGTVMIAVFLPPGEAGPEPVAPRGARRHRSSARIRLDRAVLDRMVAVGLGIAPVMMARVNRPVIVPLLGEALGLDPVWISIVFGVSAALEILLVLPAGTLMDRYGRAAVAVPCALFMGVGFLLLAVLGTVFADRGPTFALLALLLPTLLIGLGNGLGSGIVMTLGVDVSPVHGRTAYLAWWNTMLGAGRLAAPLIVTGITLFAPVAAAGAATGAVCVVGGVWLGRILPRVTPSGGTRGR
ncbi:arabinose efflux permease family protein [Brachybacterium faecium DSM 4810]|uniref:Arabinose efflux permease family protein n=1 Tax=Brachybacterium faecium (strain ATCC 43885 / DSM 4810 / JCM 11609 / LMG 19847 / NBRC 14762 / NCIMB 9860 / 6-10) TaxID=446465 RepID=C7MAN6_BRAFD|nr:MFS transporter [Brachybacterium faecium]ACU84794.1 arabinose efflux permease family protein [Brachybacterium faecium DSM 4810]